MTLILKIENFDRLEDGGPLSFESAGEAFEVGRDPSMSWTLPDPNRFISGRHFTVERQGNDYVLTDLSTNGTFLQGETNRVQSPFILRAGQKLQIGAYIISVTVSSTSVPGPEPSRGSDLWDMGGGGDPIDVSPPKPAADQIADFGSQFIDNPFVNPPEPAFVQAPSSVSEPLAPARATDDTLSNDPSGPPTTAEKDRSGDVIAALCKGAGIDPAMISHLNSEEFAFAVGECLRISADAATGLLRARAATKQFVKSGTRTMVGAQENNPLKFMPTTNEAFEVMFGGQRSGYLNGPASFYEAFKDVKIHQTAVYSAIQPALAKLLEDLSPEAIESRAGAGSLALKKNSKHWEIFVERWDAKTIPFENGMLDVFLTYFAEEYDTASNNLKS